ncbi:MAG: tRNA pseudouridine(38-40) synthase TruA [Flavobacteriales bacterium]|nr:tRNA pseudouridine(38-40) synthase TruA [Flavobacteriales bacterium]
MSRYFIELSFDGSAYRGWQFQPDRPSVQETLERAIRTVLHRPNAHVVGCGRTDTGVHASLYYAHLDHVGEAMLDDRFVHSINSLMPGDIAAKRILLVPDDAHARFSAIERGYCYRIHRQKDPFLTGRSHLLHPSLDVVAMNEGCKALILQQDFSSFCRAGSDANTMLCDVRRAEWAEVENGYRFTIRADRYLRNMVRAIVGTCLLIGRGHKPPGHMAEVVAAHDRGAAGKSAPARGLYLEYVAYPFISIPGSNSGMSSA